MRIELAYLWMTMKDELEVFILPARLYGYFVEMESRDVSYKKHRDRLHHAIGKISAQGLCPAKIRTGDDGQATHDDRVARGAIYRRSARVDPLDGRTTHRNKPVEKKKWSRQRTRDKEYAVCLAALVLAQAVDDEEAGINSNDAWKVCYDKANKATLHAFQVASQEVMMEIFSTTKGRERCG